MQVTGQDNRPADGTLRRYHLHCEFCDTHLDMAAPLSAELMCPGCGRCATTKALMEDWMARSRCIVPCADVATEEESPAPSTAATPPPPPAL